MNGPDGVTFANCGPLAADDNCRHASPRLHPWSQTGR